jgi:hypothetical protein
VEWISKHVDTVIVLGALCTGFLWINGKFNDIDRRLVRIETVLIMKDLMPKELAVKTPQKP